MSDTLNNLKVLHILDHSLPLHSGYAFRSQKILSSQRELGWRPIALTSPKHELNLQRDVAKVEQINDQIFHRSGMTCNQVPIAAELAIMWRLYRRLVGVIRTERPAILHAHSPVLNALPALWAAERFHLPVVYELRAFWEDAAVSHGTYAEDSFKYAIVSKLETYVCRKVDHVAVLCNGIYTDMIRRGISRRKITVVPNAVDARQFRDCVPADDFRRKWKLENKKVIGFVGSFYGYEGIDLLIEAFSEVARKRSDVVLLLVGGGMMESELREQVNRLELSDHVIFAGRIAHERIPGIYMLIDLLVYPRHPMRLTNLVTPLKPLEAMAMKTACIASDVGGHRELVDDGKTGILFPVGSTAALVKAILEMLVDDEGRNRIGTQGREWVTKERTWEGTTSNYIKVYRHALGLL